MSYWARRQFKEEKRGSQKEPLLQSVNSRFGRVINVGDPVVTFTQAGRSTRVDEGVFKGIMQTIDYERGGDDEEWKQCREWTYYIVERPDGKRTKLHYETSLCHADVSVRELIGFNI